MIKNISVIGGGIVGLATAWKALQQNSSLKITVIEKEFDVAQHQTGRNSGVIHSGIYYKPGSLKAINCVSGKDALLRFCDEENIHYEITGKIIVATHNQELERLKNLRERAVANRISIQLLDQEQIREREPHVTGIQGLYIASTGIVDYSVVAKRLTNLIRQSGGEVLTSFNVQRIEHIKDQILISSDRKQTVVTDFVINCAGLASDRVAVLMGIDPGLKIVPFRGEYFQLSQEKRHMCRGLIYPVPDPAFPFLGVHLTRRIDGTIECGPNAVLALAREAYRKTDFSLSDIIETFSYPGFQKLAKRFWKTGLSEFHRSLSKSAFTAAIQRLVPEINRRDLIAAPAGIRAQAVLASGELVDDYFIKESNNAIHVLNAPSPAATSCLAIASHINSLLARR